MTAALNPEGHVDLERQFRRTEVDADHWRYMSRDRPRQDWDWLAGHPVVALLAEAGSGKTHELRNRRAAAPARRFLFRVEKLCVGSLDDSHDTPEQAEAFAAWMREGGPAEFLLDAVDEAKLPQSRTAAPLRDALTALRRGVGARLADMRVLVTCRSSEWREETEQRPLRELATAMAAATGEQKPISTADAEPEEEAPADGVLCATFTPLTTEAIERLGRSRDAGEGFLAALRETGALDHAVTPLDVIHYADLFVAERERSGPGLPRTRGALIGASVERRLAERGSDRSRSKLGPDEARTGARLLCFALTMAHRRDLSTSGTGGGDGLDAVEVLAAADPPWHADRVRELLSTALFVPAAQGLVRPYRPEGSAMLAAEHLDQLIAGGLSIERVLDDLIVQSFDRPVVGRAHGPMLAWLASMRPAALRRLIEVAPELLIEEGDPRALAVEDRAQALGRYVATADRLPGDFYLARNDLPRFAEPSLEHDVVRLLETAPRGEGFNDLLRIAAAGRYRTAAPIALQLAQDPFTPTGTRVTAMVALVACGDTADLATCVRCMLAWGAPTFPSTAHKFESEREDDARHRLARHAYPGAIDPSELIRLLGQVAGKQYTTNARALAGALAAADRTDLGALVTGLDRLCFPIGDGARPHAAPPHSKRLPDLFRALVTLVGRAIRERPDLHPLIVPIHGRCLRTIRHDRGHGFVGRERPSDLYEVPPGFRMAILDAYASGRVSNHMHRVLDHALPIGRLDPDSALAEAPSLLEHYKTADGIGRRISAEFLLMAIRNMRRRDAHAWRRRLSQAAARHQDGSDARTLEDLRWRPLGPWRARYGRWRAELPWRLEHSWRTFRQDAPARIAETAALVRTLPHLADGKAIACLTALLHEPGSEDVLVLDPSLVRRRRFGSRLIRGAMAHARRHEPSGETGSYRRDDMLAFAGVGYSWAGDPQSFAAMSPEDAARAMEIALCSALPWPAWATELARARPATWRAVVWRLVEIEIAEHRSADPRFTPTVLGRIADLDADLRGAVATDLVELASRRWLPSRAEVRALRMIADANDAALDCLKRLARRRTREAVWEGCPKRVPEWLSLWASWDPAAIAEVLDLRAGPLAGDTGRAAMVRSLDRLLSREEPDGDRLARLDTELLLSLATHLVAAFPPQDDDRREGTRSRDDQRVGEEVRGGVLRLLGERHDAAGRSALERLIEAQVRPIDQRWAESWLASHSRDAGEREPWTIGEIAAYGAVAARIPRSADQLLRTVVSGIREVELELASSEFDRRALFRDAVESDVRAFLGHELDRRHRRQYAITQETVTTGEKRTDLRCELRDPTGAVTVVEIKLLHGWTRADIVEKLSSQLLERYLISERVSHGVYLLVDVGRLPIGEAQTGMDVEDLVRELREIARTDPRFTGRSVEVVHMLIDVPPKRTRKAKAPGRQAGGTRGGAAASSARRRPSGTRRSPTPSES